MSRVQLANVSNILMKPSCSPLKMFGQNRDQMPPTSYANFAIPLPPLRKHGLD